jgi:hypothetical protein
MNARSNTDSGPRDSRTFALNRQWWAHLAPKSMHQRVPELESVLRKWYQSGYGAHWLSVARNPGGVMRVEAWAGHTYCALHRAS